MTRDDRGRRDVPQRLGHRLLPALLRTVFGYTTYLFFPRHGQVLGRAYRDPPARSARGRALVLPAPGVRRAPAPPVSHHPAVLCSEACEHCAIERAA